MISDYEHWRHSIIKSQSIAIRAQWVPLQEINRIRQERKSLGVRRKYLGTKYDGKLVFFFQSTVLEIQQFGCIN